MVLVFLPCAPAGGARQQHHHDRSARAHRVRRLISAFQSESAPHEGLDIAPQSGGALQWADDGGEYSERGGAAHGMCLYRSDGPAGSTVAAQGSRQLQSGETGTGSRKGCLMQ